MNILITSAGQRVSLTRAFQKEAKKLAPNTLIFTSDIMPTLSSACRISDKFFKVLPVAHENYISNLLEICLTNSIGLIIPTIDLELIHLANHKDEFLSHGIKIVISDIELIKTCRDKRLSNNLFNEFSIEIPIQYSIEKYQFPLFIKPIDGSLSIGTGIIRTKDDLLKFKIEKDRTMLMEYIDPNEYAEYTVDAYYDKFSNLKCLVPRKRLQVRAGEVSKALTKKNNVYYFLKEKLAHIKGAFGCLTIQVFYSDTYNKLLGIEINPRFGGGYPLSYLAGANYPKYIIQEYLFEQSIPFFEEWENNLLMLRYDDEIIVNGFQE